MKLSKTDKHILRLLKMIDTLASDGTSLGLCVSGQGGCHVLIKPTEEQLEAEYKKGGYISKERVIYNFLSINGEGGDMDFR